MADFDDTRSDGFSQSEESVNSSSLTLENPYDIHHQDRKKVGSKKVDAIKKWKKKVMIWSCFLILTGGILIYSDIWYANVIGLAAGCLGIYGAIKENSEFLFVYLVLLFLELLKNVGVFFYFIQGHKEILHTILSCAGCIIEELVVVPFNIWYAFKLYRTLKISTPNDLDETLSNYQ